MKIFYCKSCIAKNKDRLINGRAYSTSLLYEPNVSYKSIDDYKGLLFKDKELTAECPICKTEMLDSTIDNIKEFDRITEYGNYSADFLLAMIDLKKNDIIQYTNQMNAVNAKAEEVSQKRYEEYLAQKNQVRCPRCGSTQISTGQTLKRGLFGLVYNQITVNRCANCGCTWEPGK